MNQACSKRCKSHFDNLQDTVLGIFMQKLMPTVNGRLSALDSILRSFAKEFGKTKEAKDILQVLPIRIMENNLHSLY